MKRIMFGNFRIAYESSDSLVYIGKKKANCEILDTKTNNKFIINIDARGTAHVQNAGQKVSKQETFMKAIKRLYDMYDKEYNHKEVA